ncbi:PepSY domain-containing protein [Oceanobacillus jeddahense]|uniref:PepSY domain-containing protein n=3 Tax=Oceanobacillus jeddahense TaxID=1462527 RepID=A0ABY5JUA9_9BACI|nr:PepSY domain-containing protein [Oceanobacillus jeddahense]UUI03928.1 PepSY domain-containing protein [Oceanobacillus jeddahense]
MKKTLLLCLTLLLSITLAACGTSDDSSTDNNATNDSDTSENANDNNQDTNTDDENTDDANTNDNNDASENDAVDLTSTSLSVEDAISAFQEKFPDTSVSSIQLDEERGELVYDIDGFDDSTEYSAEIN